MSNLAQLHKRLSSAFGPSVEPVPEISHDTSPTAQAFSRFDEIHAPEPEPDAAPEAKGGFDTEGAVRLWLGGGGLLGAALILALGLETGFYALCGALGSIAAGSVIIYLLQKKHAIVAVAVAAIPRQSRAFAPASETHDDRRWEQDENASLIGAIHDAFGDIALVREMDRRIVSANDVFRDMTGCAAPEGRTCEEMGLAFRPAGEPYRFDVEISTPYGQRIFIWHDIISRDAITGRLMVRSIGRDVTDERLMSRTREEARLKAENNSAAKSRLLATVSHEIRTPLSGILGMTHLLGQTRLTPEQLNYLNGIRQSGHALVQLVEDLLDFSTIEVGRFHLRPRSESLRLLLESVVEMLSHRAHEKGIEIASTVSPDIPELMNFDSARLRQVLFNVIGNAVKFTHTGGILIDASLGADNLVITVTDTGPGMTEDEQARVFGEFEQAGSASDRSSGTGLGLSISARIMREFSGSLSATSEKGKGSVFTIRLPHQILAEDRSRQMREGALKGSVVLLMAPLGPASTAVMTTVAALGGTCLLASDRETAEALLNRAIFAGKPFSDLIVDHRLAADFYSHIAGRADVGTLLRKIFLVNPEERNSQPQGVFDAWLIRPLRERSLVDVLRGRMRGMEKRDALNDNQPGFGFSLPDRPAMGLQIVLAEDDPVNAMLVRATLEKGGHTVRLVQDFESLLDALAGDNCPDLVVTDLNMPGGEGLDTLARIRTDERRRGAVAMPIIVLSADSREEVRRQALLNGANRVFVKPVDPARLLDEVQALAPIQQAWPEAR